ncbi:MAG: hypothetical protein RIS70_1507 [Planctomycetota bacterium]
MPERRAARLRKSTLLGHGPVNRGGIRWGLLSIQSIDKYGGAGDYFYQRMFEDIESLTETAGIHETHFGCHRKIATRHPFLIDYRLVATGVEVVAVLDGRSHPSDNEVTLLRR